MSNDLMKCSIFFVQSKIMPPCFVPTWSAIKKIENIQLSVSRPLSDLQNSLKRTWFGLVVLTVNNTDELTAIANFLLSINSKINSKTVRVLVFSKSESHDIDQLLRKNGAEI